MAKAKGKTVVIKNASTKTESKSSPTVTLARPSSNGGENFYENAQKELELLSENDTYAKKVDAGSLNEARGKDVWRLHATLKAVDDVGTTLWGGVTKLGEDLHTNSRAITSLVEKTRSDVTGSITRGTNSIEEAVSKTHSAVTSGFNKLAQATAGTEENLRTQTSAFSKEVATLLAELQGNFDKTIREFRDETTRLVDKRFNQSDVAFAAVRADQEVIKALLTDIIKDRMGRPEPRNR